MAAEEPFENVLSFRNICYEVLQSSIIWHMKNKKKVILKDVSGDMTRGINAIMGPTGSGKSSLLDILAKRKDPSWLSGKVYLNNRKLPRNYKYLSGYVVQNDILMGTLTVRESLWFSANMRLPSSISHHEKKTRVDELLEQLGLQKCSNTKIGNEMIRGISGGERKRTSIALELITKPSVLFLDEPTTGLDASTANTVMRLLKKLASRGQTVVVSIHQPRYSIFRLFDSLTLLSLGQCIYHGEASAALPYIESMGYRCETHNNPADFFLDVINGEVKSISDIGINQIDFDEDSKLARDMKITNYLREKFINSQHFKLKDLQSYNRIRTRMEYNDEERYAAPFRCQMKHLLARDFRNFIRNPESLLGTICIRLAIALVFGIIFFQIGNTAETGAQNRFGLLFTIATNLMFDATSAILTFCNGKSLFIHEYVSGYNCILAYFLSKIVAEIAPLYLLGPLVNIITYWMSGLQSNASVFFIFLLFAILTSYSSVALALFFSVTFDKFVVSNSVTVMVMLLSMIVCGFLVNPTSIPAWIAWLEYISICRYSMVGFSVNEMAGLVFEGEGCGNNSTCERVMGNDELHGVMNIGKSPDSIGAWELWQNAIALFVIGIGMFGLTYIQLVRCKKFS